MVEVVINTCYGGFGLSAEAYERLIELGIPVQAYVQEQINPETGLYDPEPRNKGQIIFADRLQDKPDELTATVTRLRKCPYWETWTSADKSRSHPLIVQVVKELGEKANGEHARLKIVEVPDDIKYSIEEYDGNEWVAEDHRCWR